MVRTCLDFSVHLPNPRRFSAIVAVNSRRGWNMAPSTKKQKVTVLLETQEWSRFDAFCRARGHKKSTLIARLVRDHLDSKGFEMQPGLPWTAGRVVQLTPPRAGKDE